MDYTQLEEAYKLGQPYHEHASPSWQQGWKAACCYDASKRAIILRKHPA